MAICLTQGYAQKQHGKASYYSKKTTGARTASGERLHHDSLTCAHKFYPFGTRLKVTNLSNQKSVEVRVTDRGPFGRGRIIDLSWAAAKKIGMIAQGVASVKVEMLDNPIPFKPESIELPKIDFEIAEAGYSFIHKWSKNNNKNSNNAKNDEASKEEYGYTTKNNSNNLTSAAQSDKNVKRDSKQENKRDSKQENKRGSKQEAKRDVKHDPKYDNKGKHINSQKETSNKWSNVFDKIKNWGADLF